MVLYKLMEVKVVSYNVGGLINPTKRRAVLSLLEHSEEDIFLLQETHLLHKDRHRMQSRGLPLQFWSSGKSKKGGVAILFFKRFRSSIEGSMTEIKGHLFPMRLQISTYNLTIASIYFPNEHQEKFLTEALAEVLHTPDSLVVVGGNLNLVMDARMDRSNPRTGGAGSMSGSGREW